MLLRDSKVLTLKDQVKKILRFSTAINNTYVMVTVQKPGEEESLIHLGQDGEVIFKKTYPDILNVFAMPSERDVILLDVVNSRIAIYDLQQRLVYHFAHQFLFEDVAQMDIETFPDSRYFCIVEHGTHNDHRLKLTYYDFHLLQQFIRDGKLKSTPINQAQVNVGEFPHLAEYLSQSNQWTYDCPIRRANSHSMICWFKPKHTEDITFYSFDVKKNEGQLREVKVKNTLGMQYGINGLQVEVATLWQARPDIFYLVCNSNKIEHNARNAAGVINNIYVLDNQAHTIRESNFFFKDAQGFAWNDQLVEYFSMGPVSVFHTFRHENGKALVTPVYYVSHETETIVAEETWEASCYFNFYVPGFDTAMMVEAYHDNGDVSTVNVTTKKVMDPKEISLHFMLSINEDFDDDLLKDAIDLLHE